MKRVFLILGLISSASVLAGPKSQMVDEHPGKRKIGAANDSVVTVTVNGEKYACFNNRNYRNPIVPFVPISE